MPSATAAMLRNDPSTEQTPNKAFDGKFLFGIPRQKLSFFLVSNTIIVDSVVVTFSQS